jgi:nucleotide-binding universal stress UspA family protein
MMIKTILVPTDGSEHAKKAVLLAADIAEKFDARMVVLHVLSSDPLPEALVRMAEVEHITPPRSEPSIAATPEGKYPASTMVGQKEDRPEIRRFVAEHVVSDAEKIAKDKGVKNVHCVIEDGDPGKEILRYAEEESANLIVMGSRGLGDLQGLLMGSVSHKVSHLSPCSCITVK